MPLVGEVAGGIGSAFQLGTGIYDLFKAGSMHPQFTPYQIPPELRAMLALSQNQLNSEMPGTAQLQHNIYSNQANSIGAAERGARGSSGLLSALAGVQGQTNNAFQNLGLLQAQNYQRNLANLQQSQQVMAGAEDKQWQLNKYLPYLRELQRKYDLTGAGEQNIMGAFGSAAQTTGQMAGLQSMLGGGAGTAQGPLVTQPLSGAAGFIPMSGAPGMAALAPAAGAGVGAAAGGGGLLSLLLSSGAFL